MSRVSPPLLPGKVLKPFHWDPMQTLGLSKDILKKEISPLLEMGRKFGWMSTEEEINLTKALEEANISKIFEKTAMWHEKLNAKEESHSKALAGWILIQNIKVMERKRKLYERPYLGLRSENIFILKKKLLEAIEVTKKGGTEKELLHRHFLGLIICHKMIRSNFGWGPKGRSNIDGSYAEFKRDILGQEIYKGNPSDHAWVLSPCYGFLRAQKWLMPTLEGVKRATGTLWLTLEEKDKSYLKSIERKLLT
jgi:hypothetical protein